MATLLLLSLPLLPLALSNPIHSPLLPGVSSIRFSRSIIPSGPGVTYDPDSIHRDAARVAAKYTGNNVRYEHNAALAALEAAGQGGRERRDAWEERGYEAEGAGWWKRGEDGEPLDVNRYRFGKRQTGAVPLTDFFQQSSDWAYFGEAQIGTPGQNFTLNFDTGSADIWVPAESSPSRHRKFDESASSTFQGTTTAWDIQYGSGQAQGLLATDTFTIGGLTHPRQVFALSNTTVTLFERLPMDGLLGMAFSTIAESRSATFFENLITSRAVADDVFQFYLQRAYDLTTQVSGLVGGGELIIGGTDSSKYTGAVTYSPVTLAGYWEIEMQGIALNGTLVPNSAVAAAIDTGTSLVYLPTAITRSFFAPLEGRQLDDGTYAIPCDTPTFTVALQFSSVQFTISEDDWFIGYAEDPRYCIVGIVGQDQNDPQGNPVAIIGDLFLKNVVSIYDYNGGGTTGRGARVGFANAVRSSNRAGGGTGVSQDTGVTGTRSDSVSLPTGGVGSVLQSGVLTVSSSATPRTEIVDVTITPGATVAGESSNVGPVNTFAPKTGGGGRGAVWSGAVGALVAVGSVLAMVV